MPSHGMAPSGAVSSGWQGERARISSKVSRQWRSSLLPAPPAHLTQRRCSHRAGADHQAGSVGGRGVGSKLGVVERRWRGLGLGDAYWWRGEREACCRSGGEGDADMGRRWPAWWQPGQRERRDRGAEKLWWCLREWEGCEWGLWAREARWRRGEREGQGRECLAGREGQRCRLWERAPPRGGPGQSTGVGGAWGTLCGAAGYFGGRGKVPRPLSICCVGVLRRLRLVQRRGWQVVRLQWSLRGVSRGGMGLGGLGSFRRRRGGRADTVPGRAGAVLGGTVVGWVVGLSAPWVVRSSQVVVLPLHGGLWAGAVGWRAVLAVVGLLVVVMVVVAVVVFGWWWWWWWWRWWWFS